MCEMLKERNLKAPNRFTRALLNTVLQSVADVYGLSTEDLKGPRRYRALTEARFVYIYLGKRLSRTMDQYSVAFMLDRHCSIVSYAERAVNAWRETDRAFCERLEEAAIAVGAQIKPTMDLLNLETDEAKREMNFNKAQNHEHV